MIVRVRVPLIVFSKMYLRTYLTIFHSNNRGVQENVIQYSKVFTANIVYTAANGKVPALSTNPIPCRRSQTLRTAVSRSSRARRRTVGTWRDVARVQCARFVGIRAAPTESSCSARQTSYRKAKVISNNYSSVQRTPFQKFQIAKAKLPKGVVCDDDASDECRFTRLFVKYACQKANLALN